MENNGNGNKPETTLVLTITMDQLTGAIAVNGPIQNPVICMGMMEMANQAIHNYAAEQAKGQRIVPAASMPFVKH